MSRRRRPDSASAIGEICSARISNIPAPQGLSDIASWTWSQILPSCLIFEEYYRCRIPKIIFVFEVLGVASEQDDGGPGEGQRAQGIAKPLDQRDEANKTIQPHFRWGGSSGLAYSSGTAMRRWHLDAMLSPSSVGHCLGGLGSFSAATGCLIIYATVNETQMLRIAICHGTTTLRLPVAVGVAYLRDWAIPLKEPLGGKDVLFRGLMLRMEIANVTGTRLVLD